MSYPLPPPLENPPGMTQAPGLESPQMPPPAPVLEGMTSYNAEEEVRKPRGTIQWIFDMVQRGQYASAAFADSMINANHGTGLDPLVKSVRLAGQEFVQPSKRLSYEDVIKKTLPEYSEKNPWTVSALGFIGDVALDPLTYTVIGPGAGIRMVARLGDKTATKVLTKTGREAYAKAGVESKRIFGELLQKREAEVAEGLAKGEVGHYSYKSLADEIKAPTPDDILSKQILENPELEQLFFRRSGLRFAGALIVPLDKVVPVTSRILQIDKLKGMVKSATPRLYESVRAGGSLVKKNFKLPAELIKVRDRILGNLNGLERQVANDTVEMFQGFSKESRESIGKMAHTVQDEVALKMKEAAKRTGEEDWWKIVLDNETKEEIFNAARVKEGIELDSKEWAKYVEMRQLFDGMYAMEREAGLLTSIVSDYFPRAFNTVVDEEDFLLFMRGGADRFSPAMRRKYETHADAIADGKDLIYDAAHLYALRTSISQRMLNKQVYKDFATEVKKGITDKGILKLIDNDVKMTGASAFVGTDIPSADYLLKQYDRLLGMWKKGATVLKPSFGVRQIFSNTIQGYLGAGIKALKAFDPQSMRDAELMMKASSDPRKYAQSLENMTLTTGTGIKLSGNELLEEMRVHRIISEAHIGNDNNIPSVIRELNKVDPKMAMHGDYEVKRGMGAMAKQGLDYLMGFPGKVEAFGRASLFMQARRMGYSSDAAARMVNKSLFDYAEALSAAERGIFKRILPFYTFNRFALPLLTETIGRNPGRIAGAAKTTDFFLKTWGRISNAIAGRDDRFELSTAERHAIPGWLLEQPSTLARWTPEGMASFNAFNNFTPFDAMSWGETGEGGTNQGSWLESMMRKTVLGSLSPFLKVPIEVGLNRNLFTNRVIRDTARERGSHRLGQMNAENADSMMNALNRVLPDKVKEAMGWEVVYNQNTGKDWVYINPWLSYFTTSAMPFMRDWINLVDDRYTPAEKALRLFGGVTTYKLDMEQQMEMKQRDNAYGVKQVQSQIQRAVWEGRNVAQHHDSLQRVLEKADRDSAIFSSSNVRGPGLP